MRRPDPFSPAWFALHLLVVTLATAVAVGLDALTGGVDTVQWSTVVFIVVTMVVVNVVVGLSERRQQGGPRPG